VKIMIEGIKYRVKAFISLCGNIVSPKVKILTLEATLNYREQHWFSKCRNLIFLGFKKVLQTVWGRFRYRITGYIWLSEGNGL